jgi:palmitoyltransferase
MSLSSIHLALVNSTTVENLTRKTKVTQLAVLIPSRPQGATTEDSETQQNMSYATVKYPLEPMHSSEEPSAASQAEGHPSRTTSTRTFAVLKTHPGENVWDLGFYENWRSVMGMRIWDWFIPLAHSPCQNHDQGESSFALGPAIDRIRREAGLMPNDSLPGGRKHTHRRKKSRRSRAGSSVSQKDSHPQVRASGAANANGHVRA